MNEAWEQKRGEFIRGRLPKPLVRSVPTFIGTSTSTHLLIHIASPIENLDELGKIVIRYLSLDERPKAIGSPLMAFEPETQTDVVDPFHALKRRPRVDERIHKSQDS
jgi:hypothetical protein